MVIEPLKSEFDRQVICPECKANLSYSFSLLNKQDVLCPKCGHTFSYDDGFILFLDNLVNTNLSVLLELPFVSGVSESGSFKTKIGKATRVRFETPFKEVYAISFPMLVGITDKTDWEQTKFKAVDIDGEGFTALSSSSNEPLLGKDIVVGYYAKGRHAEHSIPIWHIFLQYAINLINHKQYGVAIVECISAFDAFFDKLLMNQLVERRGYSTDYVKQIVRNYSRRDKLCYLLFYATGRSFENSPYDESLKQVADLRNKIVHPKEYEFDEDELTEDDAGKALSVVIQSMNWISKGGDQSHSD